MKAVLTGYFKFSPIRTETIRLPAGRIGQLMVESAVGRERWITSDDDDVMNTCRGRCGELGWYRNGGWLPRGGRSNKCAEKGPGDVLGVCVSFGSGDAAWLYMDKDFESAVLKEFFERDELRPIRKIVRMKRLPDQAWLDAFCRRSHSPAAFEKRRFGRELTLGEKKKVSKSVKASLSEWAGVIDSVLGI